MLKSRLTLMLYVPIYLVLIKIKPNNKFDIQYKMSES